MPTLKTLSMLLLLPLMWSCPLGAHELEGNRLTFVLHEQHSVALTLRLDFAGLLQHVMAPAANPHEFLLALAAQPSSVLEIPLATLRNQVEQGLQVKSRGITLPLVRWQWPDAAVVHAALRERAMAVVIAGDGASDDRELEVHAETTDTMAMQRLSIELPELIRPAVIVWSRPQQRLVGPRDAATTVEF